MRNTVVNYHFLCLSTCIINNNKLENDVRSLHHWTGHVQCYTQRILSPGLTGEVPDAKICMCAESFHSNKATASKSLGYEDCSD